VFEVRQFDVNHLNEQSSLTKNFHFNRVAMQLWFSRSGPPLVFPSRFPRELTEEQHRVMAFLLQPEMRQRMTKVVFADDWAQSLWDAFGRSEQVQDSVNLHFQQVQSIEAVTDVKLLTFLREALPIKLIQNRR
jgi:hypothetical protein